MKVKRIIEGRSYNTDTAALIYEVEDENGMQGANLYQTKHGAFFLWWYDTDYGTGGIKPLSDEAAQKWLEDNEADPSIIEAHFGEMPEAGAAERRITLRLPGNLYSRVQVSAEAERLSLNTYIMRVLERGQSPITS